MNYKPLLALSIMQNVTVSWVKKPKIMAKKPAQNVNYKIVLPPSAALTLCLSCKCHSTHCVTCLVRKCDNLCWELCIFHVLII